MKLSPLLPALLLLGTACAASDHDGMTRLTSRLADLEAKVTALAASIPPPPPKPDPLYEAPEPGWSMSGGGRDVYAVYVDDEVTREGRPTVRLASLTEPRGAYGTWARTLDVAPYVGKRVRFTMYTKTQGTTRRADFWARVQAPDSPGDGSGLGGHWTYLPADSDWTRQEIVLDVDPRGAHFNYGVGIAGPGVMWFDAPTIEGVGTDVPVTPLYPGEQTVNEWLMTGVGAPDFKLAAEDKAVSIERSVATSQRFVAVVRAVPAGRFAGKKAKVAFDVRTEGLDNEGSCTVKVQNERELAYSGYLAVEMKRVPPTTKDFTPCNLEVLVPKEAKWILYGFTYRGAGKAWVRGGTIK